MKIMMDEEQKEEFEKELKQTVEESYQAGFLDALGHVQESFNTSIEFLKHIFDEYKKGET